MTSFKQFRPIFETKRSSINLTLHIGVTRQNTNSSKSVPLNYEESPSELSTNYLLGLEYDRKLKFFNDYFI